MRFDFEALRAAIFGKKGPPVVGDEWLVLDFLGPYGGDKGTDEWRAFSFADIDRDLKIGRDRVRTACRSLSERGLTAYEAHTWDEDGMPYGAGYRATHEGRHIYWNITYGRAHQPKESPND